MKVVEDWRLLPWLRISSRAFFCSSGSDLKARPLASSETAAIARVPRFKVQRQARPL
jgi:hypothetical protein